MAIIAPPSIGVDAAAALIHKTLAEINSEAMFGLHGRSQKIETQVVKSGQTIEELQAQVISSNEKLKRMEATNDILLVYLKEQKEKFEVYKKEVEGASLWTPPLQSIVANDLQRKSVTRRQSTTRSPRRRSWCKIICDSHI